MKRCSTLGALGVLAFVASPAFAQVQTRDHRKRPAPPPAANVKVKAHPAKPIKVKDHRGERDGDHRRDDKVRDHRAPGAPAVRDHRGDRDHRAPGAPAVRDHRGDRDHRGQPAAGAMAPMPARQIAPHPPCAPGRPNQVVRAHRRGHRNHDRVVVSGFWPREGRPGTTVMIRGENFANGTVVLFGETELAGAKVSPGVIQVAIPRRTAAGMISLRTPGRHRALAVGSFRVTAKAPPKRPRWRTEAEKRWKERRKKFARSEAARQAALQAQEEQLAATREQRRKQRIAARRAKFEADFLADGDTVAELELHADRAARLQRMLRLASAGDMKAIGVRVEIAIAREDARHDARMKDLRAAFGKEGTDQ